MSGALVAFLNKECEADCLGREEDEHSNHRGQEEKTTSGFVDKG